MAECSWRSEINSVEDQGTTGRERSSISQFYEAGLIQEMFIKTMKATQGRTRRQRGEQRESTQGESGKIKARGVQNVEADRR